MKTSSYFRLRHSRSMKMLSRNRPRPSMLTRTPRVSNSSRNAALVNCTPWSVLKISGWPCRSIASRSAAMQKSVSIVIDSRQARTRRLNQSITATR